MNLYIGNGRTIRIPFPGTRNLSECLEYLRTYAQSANTLASFKANSPRILETDRLGSYLIVEDIPNIQFSVADLRHKLNKLKKIRPRTPSIEYQIRDIEKLIGYGDEIYYEYKKFFKMGDFHPENLVFSETKGWIVLDFAEVELKQQYKGIPREKLTSQIQEDLNRVIRKNTICSFAEKIRRLRR